MKTEGLESGHDTGEQMLGPGEFERERRKADVGHEQARPGQNNQPADEPREVIR